MEFIKSKNGVKENSLLPFCTNSHCYITVE